MIKLEKGLSLLREGMYSFSGGLLTFDENYDFVENVVNGGTEEGYALEKFPFRLSVDEECCDWLSWIDDFCMEYGLSADNGNNLSGSVEQVVIGLDKMVEGAELIVEALNDGEIEKNELKYFKSNELRDTPSSDFSIFKEYGFSTLVRSLRGYRQAYNKELKDLMGKYQYYKILG